MAWMDMLYKTYDANIKLAGKSDEKVQLSLIAHMVCNAQVEIVIDKDGVFHRAFVLDKNDCKTIIPVTEASASRSSGIEPHGLCDTLSYIAGDFANYASKSGNEKEKFLKYYEQLKKWKESSYRTGKIDAIYNYISKKNVTLELIKCGILDIDENKKFLNNKINGNTYDKTLVRFRVLGFNPEGTWEDLELFDNYIKYYLSKCNSSKDICFLKGAKTSVSSIHPKGIVASNYGAKLISANDKDNFTFRGRFNTSEEACTIGYEASQKVHNALTWLCAKQGITIGSTDKRTYVCWNPSGHKVLNNFISLSSVGLDDDDEDYYTDDTEEKYKNRLYNTISGYKNELNSSEDIVIMGLDAATTGRLSVTYYNELTSSDFYERIDNWYNTMFWYFKNYSVDKKMRYIIKTPNMKEIINCCFGTEQNNMLATDDKIMKEQMQRFVYCMIDNKPISYDIVYYLFCRSSNPTGYSYSNRDKILSTACAVTKKYYNDKGVNFAMKLDENNTDRSYLFGRLLAVAEYAERSTFEKGEDREPNAIKLQSTFVRYPLKTLGLIEGMLTPYYQKLSPGTRVYVKGKMSDIYSQFLDDDYVRLNNPLDEKYLLGYYLQRKELYSKKDTLEK